ncbi:hypothetical protein I551_3159 [Mycobacterium ulcerans str. Harvey]|uniref:Uncharacterized protein n=1 Tax=Mycobacterium ulcerans str. Harvey TaxID=1299332 RepID=A0ABP3AGK7_MYCUL|nr:hypothetical protein I551_3159 [Mycobacterium ulcerans str. Harvey]
MVAPIHFRRGILNLLLDYLYDDLVVGKHVQNPSEGAVRRYQYPKVAIELSDFFIRQMTLGHFLFLG